MATTRAATFAELLRQHRKTAGFTQPELAERAGLSVRGINDLERGSRRAPRRDTVALLADALSLAEEDRAAFRAAARQRAPAASSSPAAPAAPSQGSGASESGAPPVRIFLIADVRGYTRFTAEQGDEAGAALAAKFAALVREVVEARAGQLLELRGDEALVVFASARQALHAAVAAQARFALETAADPALPLRAGIGLDAGEAVPVAGGYRGSALNLAARLCSLAGPGEVLASETVAGLARRVPGLAYAERGHVQLKGFSDPVRVIQVSGEEAGQAPAQTEAIQAHVDGAGSDAQREPALPIGGYLGALPDGPIVAREAELGRIVAALDAVSAGTGRLVLLAGEPGVGKTRLAQEATLAARNRGFSVATGRCYEPMQVVGYYPFLEALTKAYALASATIRDDLPRRWPDVSRLLPDQYVGVEPPTGARGGGPDEQQRLFWQVTGFLQVLAAERPLALLLDDLQWADGASLTLLQHLASHTREHRILLLGTCREEEIARRHLLESAFRDLAREKLIERVAVRRLPVSGTAAQMAAILGQGEVSSEFAELLHGRTDGNPFFTHEVLRELAERGDLYQEEGRWRRRELAAIVVPESVRSVLGQRLEHLSGETRDVLREASVLGQAFTFEDLQGIGSRTEAEVESALEQAAAAGLVRESGSAGYTFHHVLIQQALYSELSARRRQRLHRQAGEAIERLSSGAVEWREAELAWHFREGKQPAQELLYALRAGDQAEGVFAHSEAEAHYNRALELARELKHHAREAEALEKLGDLLELTGRDDDARHAYERVVALDGTAQLPERDSLWRAHLHHKIALTFNSQRRLEDAEDACARGEAALGEQPVEPMLEWWQAWVDIHLLRMTLHYWQGHLPELAALAEADRSIIERYGTPRQRVEYFNALVNVNTWRELLVLSDETVGYARAALAGAQELGHLRDIADGQFIVGFVLLWHGDLDAAEDALHATLALAERTRSGRYGDLRTLCFTYLTVVHRKRGQVAEAQSYAERALAAATEQQISTYSAMARANLAWVAWRKGELVASERLARDSLEQWTGSKVNYPLHWAAHWPLLAIALDRDDLPDAVAQARAMLAPPQQPPPNPLKSLLEAAVQAWDAGQGDAARAHLTGALPSARESGYL